MYSSMRHRLHPDPSGPAQGVRAHLTIACGFRRRQVSVGTGTPCLRPELGTRKAGRRSRRIFLSCTGNPTTTSERFTVHSACNDGTAECFPDVQESLPINPGCDSHGGAAVGSFKNIHMQDRCLRGHSVVSMYQPANRTGHAALTAIPRECCPARSFWLADPQWLIRGGFLETLCARWHEKRHSEEYGIWTSPDVAVLGLLNT